METTTKLDPTMTKNSHTEWTDEKHSLYLKGMEATFVNQLYSSANSIGLHSRNENSLDPNSSRQMHFSQFKFFQGGCGKKVCYDSRYPMASPWNRHFRLGREHQAVVDPSLQETAESVDCGSQSREEKAFSCKLAASSKLFQPGHGHCRVQDLEGGENEVSDQNFVGEDIEGMNSSSVYIPKRLKRL